MKLMLHPKWPGTFRRTIALEGGLSQTLVFQLGDPVDVSDEQVVGLQCDVGKALVVPRLGTAKADFEATDALVACEVEDIPTFIEIYSSPADSEEDTAAPSTKTDDSTSNPRPQRRGGQNRGGQNRRRQSNRGNDAGPEEPSDDSAASSGDDDPTDAT